MRLRRLDERRYRVTLTYDRQDETEMVIRILSFGSVIRVTEPQKERKVAAIREDVTCTVYAPAFMPIIYILKNPSQAI